MADNHNQQEQNKIDELNETLTSASERIADNKKVIFWVVGAIVLVAVFVMSYFYFYKNPGNDDSFAAYAKVATTADNDTIAAREYQKVAQKYGSHDGGNLANLAAGQSYYNIGKYKEALECLKKFSTSDKVLMANVDILVGDCYVNLKNYPEALAAFDKGIKAGEGNDQIVPRAQLKKAVVFDHLKKYNEALECYQIIRDEFPQFVPGSGMSIDGYIAREQARIGK
ncbi:MAG: tetratricopeptide repeat protein [Prevotella sp.]|nr:tetratricopeptide repeat protein [Bacteroides sp.]MCM1366647.1 tetratricopeptide repeat protein [Prevotella sp.]MCM1437314.1 tetratricopeptide repeat protein [Prevotella sp.]